MSDIALTHLLLNRTAVQSGPPGVSATVTNAPPDVARGAPGSILQGVVKGHDTAGHPLIQTRQGALTLATNLSLAAGSQVTLQLRSAGSELHVSILQVNGRPVSAHAPQTAPPSLAATPPRPAAQPQANTPATASAAPAGTHWPAEATVVQGQGTAQARPQTASSGALPGGPAVASAAHSNSAAPATAMATTAATEDVLALGQRFRAVVQSVANPTANQTNAPPAGQVRSGDALPRLQPSAGLQVQILRFKAPGPTAGGHQTPSNPQGAVPAGISANALTSAGQTAGLPGQPPAGSLSQPAAPLSSGSPLVSLPGVSAGGAPTASAGPPLPPVPAAPPATAEAAAANRGPPPALPAAAPASPTSSPVASSVAAATAPGGITLAATVAQPNAAGQTLLATPAGVLALEVQAQLPVGSRLQIALFDLSALPPDDGVKPDSLKLLPQWTALEDALRSLMEAAPIDRQGAALPPGVAQIGPRLASGMLFFLSALATGDLSSWLGQKPLEALTALGRGDLAASLAQDFAQTARLAESAGNDWRFVPLPLFDGQQVHPLRFFFRRGRGGGGRDDSEVATRFIIEVEMSRLGDLQLDGLVRPRRFDLILRTRMPLAPHMRREIAAIYETANEIGGTSGQIAFQANETWRLMPLGLGQKGADALVI